MLSNGEVDWCLCPLGEYEKGALIIKTFSGVASIPGVNLWRCLWTFWELLSEAGTAMTHLKAQHGDGERWWPDLSGLLPQKGVLSGIGLEFYCVTCFDLRPLGRKINNKENKRIGQLQTGMGRAEQGCQRASSSVVLPGLNYVPNYLDSQFCPCWHS